MCREFLFDNINGLHCDLIAIKFLSALERGLVMSVYIQKEALLAFS